MKLNQLKSKNQLRRKAKTRAKIFGTAAKPRLSVFRSLKNIEVQLIDDATGKTIVAAHTRELPSKNLKRIDQAAEVGKLLAKKALEKNIKQAVFDRSSYKYHGRIKAVADGARSVGLNI